MRELLELHADATFGTMELSIDTSAVLPEGTIAKVNFPTLMRLGTPTPDGRWFDELGFSVEPLPLPMLYKDRTTATPGHDGARICGSLRSVDLSPDGVVSGSGYLIDNPAGHDALLALKTKSVRGTSADLRECALDNAAAESMNIRAAYARSKLAAVTIVPIPAFPDAFAELDQGLVASATLIRDLRPPRDAFDNPRLTQETGIRVVPLNEEFNQVFGHLAVWKHEHIGGGKKFIPPPRDDDFSYFYSGGTVLCDDQTYVPVGRIFIGGDHAATNLQAQEALDHYTATSLSWADVRVGKDNIGIWFAGVSRPGVNEELMYAARASAVSGDWRTLRGKKRLIAIVSCNRPGFPIMEPGVALADDDELALVASVAPPTEESDVAPVTVEDVEEEAAEVEADLLEEAEEVEAEIEADSEDPAPRARVIVGGLFDPVRVDMADSTVRSYIRNGRRVRSYKRRGGGRKTETAPFTRADGAKVHYETQNGQQEEVVEYPNGRIERTPVKGGGFVDRKGREIPPESRDTITKVNGKRKVLKSGTIMERHTDDDGTVHTKFTRKSGVVVYVTKKVTGERVKRVIYNDGSEKVLKTGADGKTDVMYIDKHGQPDGTFVGVPPNDPSWGGWSAGTKGY